MKIILEHGLLASISFIICLLTRSPNCKQNSNTENTNSLTEGAEIAATGRRRFPVYWNVPTFQCHKYGFNFSRVANAWGIEQNLADEFRGERISILYDPGEFPALLTAATTEAVPRNGGVPQEGSLMHHLKLFQMHVEKLVMPDFKGLGIIDFEHWRPVWHQNWGTLNSYRDYSRTIERKRHPFWFNSMIEIEAVYRYELSAKTFILETLRKAKELRPNALWGYYGYPFCFNFTPNNNREACSDEVVVDNDNMQWLFSESTAHYPSLYLKERDMGPSKRRRFVRGRLVEALRIANNTPVYPYVWYKYHDSNQFLTEDDMYNVLTAPRDRGCTGVVIWGASKDVNTEAKCLALADYLENVIGPAVSYVNSLPTTTPEPSTLPEDSYTEESKWSEEISEEFTTTDKTINPYTEQTMTEETALLSEETTVSLNYSQLPIISLYSQAEGEDSIEQSEEEEGDDDDDVVDDDDEGEEEDEGDEEEEEDEDGQQRNWKYKRIY